MPGEAYNVGSGEQVKTWMAAIEIARFAGAPAPESAANGKPYYEIPVQVLDSQKIGRLGWHAETRLRNGLRDTLEWYRDYLSAKVAVTA